MCNRQLLAGYYGTSKLSHVLLLAASSPPHHVLGTQPFEMWVQCLEWAGLVNAAREGAAGAVGLAAALPLRMMHCGIKG